MKITLSRKFSVLLVALFVAFGFSNCTVHIDTDPLWHDAEYAAGVYLASLHACARAADTAQEQAVRESAAVLCALGLAAIDEYEEDH